MSKANERIDDPVLIADLLRVADIVGKPPSKNEYGEHGQFHESVLKHRFGSWIDSIERAGLEPTEEQVRTSSRYGIDDADLIEDIQRVHEQCEGPLTQERYEELGDYSRTTVTNRFDDWITALRTAGIEPTRQQLASATGYYAIPTDDLIADLDRVCSFFGRAVTNQEYREYGKYEAKTVVERFGSTAKAIEAAGWEPTEEQRRKAGRLSLERLTPDDIPALSDTGERATGGGD